MRALFCTICFFLGLFPGLWCSGVLYLKYEGSEKHIELLETYIEDNHLPTPARKP